MAFAVCRLGIPTGTAKFRPVIGLRQISWLPRPCLTREQPACLNKSRKRRSKGGATQAAVGIASRKAMIWMKIEPGSMSG